MKDFWKAVLGGSILGLSNGLRIYNNNLMLLLSTIFLVSGVILLIQAFRRY